MAALLLAVNGGSSSIKFALYAAETPLRCLLRGKVDRLGTADATLQANPADGHPQTSRIEGTSVDQAVASLVAWLKKHLGGQSLSAVGHRIVHGGPRFSQAAQVTGDMIGELKRLVPLDPNHLPAEIELIEAFARQFAGLPQVACFDTAFHHDLPRVAQLLPVPRRFAQQGVRRFGFHGLSYAYLLEELAALAGRQAAQGRVILAHLGAGASMAAVRDGRCRDTTMAFTPTAGLVMATRSGDIDPGLLIYLLRSERLSADQLDHLVNHESGLLGLSETSADMRDLLRAEPHDPRAAEAVAVFCYQAQKWIGALAAGLGGLDTLVFSGGIGENAPPVRERICTGLEFLGLHFESERNQASAPVISADGSQVCVRVIPTDEETMIARETHRLLQGGT